MILQTKEGRAHRITESMSATVTVGLIEHRTKDFGAFAERFVLQIIEVVVPLHRCMVHTFWEEHPAFQDEVEGEVTIWPQGIQSH